MTGPAVKGVVVRIKRPTGLIMRESWTFFSIVTLGAGISLVATIADRMNLLLSLVAGGRALDIVTIAAILLSVAVDTPKSEEVDMFLVLKGYDRTVFVRCVIDFLRRSGDHGM